MTRVVDDEYLLYASQLVTELVLCSLLFLSQKLIESLVFEECLNLSFLDFHVEYRVEVVHVVRHIIHVGVLNLVEQLVVLLSPVVVVVATA